MMTQIKNPALLNSRFRFDEVLFLDASFHWLNLTRGSSYLPLLDWLAGKKVIINRQNDDEECFKWAVITAENFNEINKSPQHISNLRKFQFPVAIKDFNIFEMNNDIFVTVLLVENKDIYICRKTIRRDLEINLLLISEGDRWHYAVIKSLSRLLARILSMLTNSTSALTAYRALHKN